MVIDNDDKYIYKKINKKIDIFSQYLLTKKNK